VPPCGGELSNQTLRRAIGVDVGGIDEVAAAFDVGSENALRFIAIGSPVVLLAERHGAQTEG
jgi:hypothetical protein